MIRRGPPDEYSFSIKDSFLIFEIVYFLILFLFFKKKKMEGGAPALPLRGPCTVLKVFSGNFLKSIQHDGESLRT